jgi:two-component system chemotaxis response regulator CheB
MQVLLPGLAENFPWPVVVVQHRSREPGSELCKYLRRCCHRDIVEPEDKEPIMGGNIYLAPRDYHLLIERGNFALSTEAPVYFARPSIDVLFESAADAYGGGIVAVVLTGANGDGARGVARVKAAGGVAVVQEPATARAPEMPRAAIEAARVDCVLPLSEIAPFLNGLGREAAR